MPNRSKFCHLSSVSSVLCNSIKNTIYVSLHSIFYEKIALFGTKKTFLFFFGSSLAKMNIMLLFYTLFRTHMQRNWDGSIFSRVLRDATPRFVGLSVGWSHFTFLMIFILWPYCSRPNDLVTSNMAPAHPHATGVPMYPALFFIQTLRIKIFDNGKSDHLDWMLSWKS